MNKQASFNFLVAAFLLITLLGVRHRRRSNQHDVWHRGACEPLVQLICTTVRSDTAP